MDQAYRCLSDVDLDGKRVIIREDLNVPMDDKGNISSHARIERAVPTIVAALKANAKVMILSHFGRPKEGQFDAKFSLAPVAKALSDALGQTVPLIKDWLNEEIQIEAGQAVLCENVRFNVGEKNNDSQLAQQMAKQCDVFVMDAFATAHRKQASTYGIAEFAPIACAGPLLDAEITALSQALKDPKRPLLAIVGGSKVSTKFQLLENLLQKVDKLIVGGGIANTFLAAKAVNIGKSLYEADWVEQAKHILHVAEEKRVQIPLPQDVCVASEFSANAVATVKELTEISDQDMILDVGPKTAAFYRPLLSGVGTVLWNGPVGVFEFPAFSQGTQALGQAIADSSAYSLAGGGDTVAALDQFGISDKISYISTGGGAFLEFLEGKTLPAINILNKRNLT